MTTEAKAIDVRENVEKTASFISFSSASKKSGNIIIKHVSNNSANNQGRNCAIGKGYSPSRILLNTSMYALFFQQLNTQIKVNIELECMVVSARSTHNLALKCKNNTKSTR